MNPDDVRFVFGNTANEVRQSAIKEFRKGVFKILIGSTIFDAGVNIPAISGVVLAGAGNSEITLIQRIGRGARNVDYEQAIGYLPDFLQKTHGKKVTKIIDIFDTNVKFFRSQAWNRYLIARDEFGVDRVHLVGDNSIIRKKKKSQKQLEDQLKPSEAQLELLKEFQSSEPFERKERAANSLQQDMFDAFKNM
jgi:superfamily II DNA or RNA helicase